MSITQEIQSAHRSDGKAGPHALVLGGSGLLGGSLIRRLDDLPEWRVTSMSRRDIEAPVRHINADLMNIEDLRRVSGELTDVTHVFFCARVVSNGYAIDVDSNAIMLENVIEMLSAASRLTHVQIVHGLKWYGSHVGPIKLPAKESDPPHENSSFYRKQQEFLTKRQAGQNWTWSSVRPHYICGVATDSPSNLVSVLGTFAVILRELGDELWFPGSQEAFDAITNVADVDLLTEVMLAAASEPRCANTSFNVANGDCFRWRDIWPFIARRFGMTPGQPRNVDLPRFMEDKEPIWRSIVRASELRNTQFDMMADWSFAHNNVFGIKWDLFASTVKSSQLGIARMIDTEEMFDRLFTEYQELRILPR